MGGKNKHKFSPDKFRNVIVLEFESNNVSERMKIMASRTTDKQFVPEWAKSAVWYQIFPERFRNGNPQGNPTIESLKGADPQEQPKQWHIHPWGSDWYKLLPYEIENGEPEMWKHLLRRRYGGDLQGIIDKIDYLQDLGITALYLNPVFISPSAHKYDGCSYHHIDPFLGPDPQGDLELISNENPLDPKDWVWTAADRKLLELIEELHKRDMRIILDGVFNHMGYNSFAFQDVLQHQEQSPYADWFKVTSWRDEAKGSKFEWLGWDGHLSLPEFAQDENGIVSGAKDYIFQSTQRWMNPDGKGIQYGIDGWRLDVAFLVKHPFWKQWRKWVKKLNPEAYLTAELIKEPEIVKPFFEGDEFDGEMNYNFAFACSEFFFQTNEHQINASEFDEKLKELRKMYPEEVAYVSQTLFSSHDTDRLASHIVNHNYGRYRDFENYYHQSKATSYPFYNPRKPNEQELQKQKLFVLFQMTYLGAPMIYYGDEVGMWGGNDPCCRKPMLWADIEFEDESFNPDGQSQRAPEKVEINDELFNYYKDLIQIRKQFPALQKGDFNPVLIDDRGIYAFERSLGEESLLVVLNNSDNTFKIDFDVLNLSSDSKAIFIDGTCTPSDHKLVLDPESGAILK